MLHRCAVHLKGRVLGHIKRKRHELLQKKEEALRVETVV
jgi:hypothetical protein